MPEPTYKCLKSRIDQGVLILTVTVPNIRTDRDADALRHELIAAIDASGLKKVVIEMQQVEFLSSTGLRPLISAFRHLKSKEGRLLLCGMQPLVARTLTTTRLVGMTWSPFEMQPDLASALAHLNKDGEPAA